MTYDQNLINNEEFILLHDISTSSNLEFPSWKNSSFNLQNISDAECTAEFRFPKSGEYKLAEVLKTPPLIKCYNRWYGMYNRWQVFDDMECFCLFLKWFAYPCCYGNLVPRFGRLVPEFYLISNTTLDHIYNRFGLLLHDFNQLWHTPQQLDMFADKIHSKQATLDNCSRFVDDIVKPVCRSGHNQRIIYIEHKHSLSFFFMKFIFFFNKFNSKITKHNYTKVKIITITVIALT